MTDQTSAKGIQYYWAIAVGLLAGPAFALILSYYDGTISGNTWMTAGLVLLLIAAFVAYLVVAIEIWQRFGLLAAIAAYVAFPVSIVYWFSRIRGIGDTRSEYE